MHRALLCVLALIVLTACDGYIEEARITSDRSVDFAAQATVVCTDELQVAIWGGDPCEPIDEALRSGDYGAFPLGVELDENRVSVVADGDLDRRVLDANWTGKAEELSSLLVSGGEVRVLDELRAEARFDSTGTPYDRIQQSTDSEVIEALRRSRWEPAEFRIRVPDLIEEHNADRIQGRFAIWYIDGDHPDEFRVQWTSEEAGQRWWWLILGVLVLLGVVAMIVILEGPRSRRSRAEADAAETS